MSVLNPKISENVTIIAGMPRAGTTWLYSVLNGHPAVKLPVRKETNFYSTNFTHGVDWYHQLYQDTQLGQHKSFDISPIYFFDEQFIENYRLAGSQQKVILILREIDSWVQSAYWQVKSYDPFLPDFPTFVKNHNFKLEDKSVNVKIERYDFIRRVEQFRQAFPGKLLLIEFEAIQQRPVELLNLIERFAQLPSYFNLDNTATDPVNASGLKTGFVSMLSNIKWFNRLVLKLFPRHWIVKVRDKFVYNSSKKLKAPKPLLTENYHFAKELFKTHVFKQTWFDQG